MGMANNTGLRKVRKSWRQQLVVLKAACCFETHDMKSIINLSNKVFTEFA
jgi:hypothetical protein